MVPASAAVKGSPQAAKTGHERAAAFHQGDRAAVCDEVDLAAYGHGSAREARQGDGGAAGLLHRVRGVHAAHAALLCGLKTPQARQGDGLAGVAADDGGLATLAVLQQLGAQRADSQAHRVEHPGGAGLVQGGGGCRDGLLVDGHERAHVEVHGLAAGQLHAFVRHVDHRRAAANRQLGVGDEVDGDEVRDGGRHGVGSAHGGGAVLQLGADGALFDHGQVLLSDLRALRPAVFGC